MKTKQQAIAQTNRVFDVPFVVQEKTTQQDDNGIEREVWVQKYKLFADGGNLYGKEYMAAKQMDNDKTIKFIIKYGPQIDEKMRIVFNEKIFDIENIDNIRYKNELLEIRATEKRVKK